MTPLALFESIWERCAHLTAIHAFLAQNAAPALKADEILRSEWAARVSALDLFVHELVAQGMEAVFVGSRPTTNAYLRFRVSNEALERIRRAPSPADAVASFDLDVREQLSRITYQLPDDISDGVKLFSDVDLWNELALHLGASQQQKVADAKQLKAQLTMVVRRRNKIVHEGDLQPTAPRVPWPITQSDVASVATLIERVVRGIDAVA